MTLQQQQRLNKASTNPGLRHSFNGTDVQLNFSTPPPSVSAHPSLGVSSPDGSPSPNTPRTSGHSRSGSAGNWGSISRSSNLAAPSLYPRSSSPTPEVNVNTPWSTSELAVGSSRLNEKAWA